MPKEKSVGDASLWQAATEALVTAVKEEGFKLQYWTKAAAAFYGPKIDIKIKDAQTANGSVPLFSLISTSRNALIWTYIDSQAKKPGLIWYTARLWVLLNAFLEYWLSIIPDACLFGLLCTGTDTEHTEKQDDYGHALLDKLKKSGIRAEFDSRNEKIGFKIREATLRKEPLHGGDRR